MTGQMMDNYAREVDDFAFLPLRGSRHSSEEKDEKAAMDDQAQRRLRVTIGISGWLTEKEEVITPWRVLGSGTEVFALRWELEALMNLGNSMTALVRSTAWGYAQSEIIKRTIFAEMMGALWPLGLLKVSRVVDNPFSVAKARAEKAGDVLADALMNRVQGERPVTLIGYSLGARVIYRCLLRLVERGGFGLVESVVLMGAPVPRETGAWRRMRAVVAGRVVNVYSGNDYVLGFLYRTGSVQFGVAGLEGVEGVEGVENVDVGGVVDGHLRYRYAVGGILKMVGFGDLDLEEVEREEGAMRKMIEEEKKRMTTLKKQVGLGGEGNGEGVDVEVEADRMEKEVKAKTQKTLMQRAAEQFSFGRGDGEGSGNAQRGEGGGDGAESGVGGQKSYYQMAVDQLHFGAGKEKEDEGRRTSTGTGTGTGDRERGQGQGQGQGQERKEKAGQKENEGQGQTYLQMAVKQLHLGG